MIRPEAVLDIGHASQPRRKRFEGHFAYHQLPHVLPRVVNLVLVAKGAVVLHMNPLALVPGHEVVLLQPGVALELVRRGHRAALLDERLELRLGEVGHPHSARLAGGRELGHGLPGVDVGDVGRLDVARGVLGELVVAGFEGRGPVHQVEVDVVHAEVLEGLVQGAFDVLGRVLVVPKLGGDEELGAVDAGFLDGGPDHGLGPVDWSSSYQYLIREKGGGRVDALAAVSM